MDYQRFFNPNALAIKPSGIRKYFDVLADMPDALSLGVGEPDFDTPWNACNAAIRSIQEGRTHYTSNAGMPALRQAIARFVATRYGVEYTPDEVLVTVGASEGIDLAMRALVHTGDEVLIPEPCFVSYSPCVSLANGTPVPLPCYAKDGFKLRADVLQKAITSHTKLLVLPYPNNPTGAVMTREDLEPIARLVQQHDLLVLSDEIYAELTYQGVHCSVAALDEMRQRTILINGFSKAFAMTGWRLGYLCAPAPLRNVMLKIHQFGLMCASTNAQYAGLEVLQSGFEDDFASVTSMRAQYDMRRKYLVASLNEMGLECQMPQGAFYAFPCVRSTGLDGTQFTEALLAAQRLAVVPGEAFGQCGKDHVRISYAYSMEKIAAALARMRRFVADIRR